MHRRRGSRRYLAGYLIKYNRDQLVRELEVGGLEDVIRAIKNDDSIAGNVGLRIEITFVSSRFDNTAREQKHTIICLPSQVPVVTAWSLAWGLPGRIARMEAMWGRVWR
jgi:hypothetical protein